MSTTVSSKSIIVADEPDYFAALPTELQDMIFGQLGWELRSFYLHRSTAASALQALQLFFAKDCQSHPDQMDTSNFGACVAYQARMPTRDFEFHINRQLLKPKSVLDIIKVTPKLSGLVRELSLLIPYYDLPAEPDCRVHLTARHSIHAAVTRIFCQNHI